MGKSKTTAGALTGMYYTLKSKDKTMLKNSGTVAVTVIEFQSQVFYTLIRCMTSRAKDKKELDRLSLPLAGFLYNSCLLYTSDAADE